MRLARSTGAMSGFTVILLGIWGGIIPFVGPYFDYSFGSNATWHYTSNRLWLCILPAIAVVLGGLMMLRADRRAPGASGGWLALVGGSWFVIGPAVSRLWEHSSAGPIGAPLYGDVRQMAELLGYFYGLGALIIALASVAIGRFLTRPALKGATNEGAPMGAEAGGTAGATSSTGSGTEEGRRRRAFGSRRGRLLRH